MDDLSDPVHRLARRRLEGQEPVSFHHLALLCDSIGTSLPVGCQGNAHREAMLLAEFLADVAR